MTLCQIRLGERFDEYQTPTLLVYTLSPRSDSMEAKIIYKIQS